MLEIIGMGCRYPGGVTNANKLWRLLQSTTTAVHKIPSDRWDNKSFVSSDYEPGKTITDSAGWLDDIERFDYGYFKLSKKEAAEMDPQQRLVMEVTIEALLDANINPESLSQENVGVFVGAGIAEGQAMAFTNIYNMTQHTSSGTSLAMVSNRLSYFLDLIGPSLTIDTACSSALTAFHYACQSLIQRECELAIVGGVNTLLGPGPFIAYSQAHMLSKTGVLRPFDEKADGFVHGEGCGVVVLCRSDSSLLQNRRSYASVLATGVGEDGKTNSLTMPSTTSQARLMTNVLHKSGLCAEQIMYVEAHGTGTTVGDSIEAQSIATAFVGNRLQPLSIGSIKGHIGHLETAAGIAGLQKAVLCLHHNEIPLTAGHQNLAPKIAALNLNLRVPTASEILPRDDAEQPIGIGVCSYGFGGANAFTILTHATFDQRTERSATKEQNDIILPLSAHYQAGLTHLENAYRELPSSELRQAASWSALERPALRYRKIFLNADSEDFFHQAQVFAGVADNRDPKIVFCYGGQGAHYPTMGIALYEKYALFRETVDQLNALYEQLSGISLMREYGFCQREMDARQLDDVQVSVPCIVIYQVALTQLLTSFGIKPTVVLGHSTGEMCAAWTCGALTLEDLCLLSKNRAELQHHMPTGAMAVWFGEKEEVARICKELAIDHQVVVAATNTPSSLTLAGDSHAIEKMLKYGESTGVRCKKLNVQRAFHSHHVQLVAQQGRQLLAPIKSRPFDIPFVSTVKGHAGQVFNGGLDGDYWWDNIAEPVEFYAGSLKAAELGDIMIDLSPGGILSGYLSENTGARLSLLHRDG